MKRVASVHVGEALQPRLAAEDLEPGARREEHRQEHEEDVRDEHAGRHGAGVADGGGPLGGEEHGLGAAREPHAVPELAGGRLVRQLGREGLALAPHGHHGPGVLRAVRLPFGDARDVGGDLRDLDPLVAFALVRALEHVVDARAAQRRVAGKLVGGAGHALPARRCHGDEEGDDPQPDGAVHGDLPLGVFRGSGTGPDPDDAWPGMIDDAAAAVASRRRDPGRLHCPQASARAVHPAGPHLTCPHAHPVLVPQGPEARGQHGPARGGARRGWRCGALPYDRVAPRGAREGGRPRGR